MSADPTPSSPLIAVIPARGGSKRIPRKNVRPFLGVPLIARTIGTLRRSGLFDRIVVSTDDDEIARVATDAGADVPFLRESHLADDHTPTAPVVANAIRWLESDMSTTLDPVCVVYPAAVFVKPADLRSALDQLNDARADLVFAASRFPAPIQRGWRIDEDGTASMLWPEHRVMRSQDLEPVFYDAGYFYWGRRTHWLEEAPDPQNERVLLHVLPRTRAVDIDTEEDWDHAELLFRAAQLKDAR